MVQPVFSPYAIVNFGTMEHAKQDARRRAGETVRPKGIVRAAPGAVPARASWAATYRFTPSLQQRRASLAAFVARAKRVDPRGATMLAEEFANTDQFVIIDRAIRPLGLSAYNVADAFAVYWINAWSAAHSDGRMTDRRTALAVRDQVAALMASTGIPTASPALKQEMAEGLLIHAGLAQAWKERAQREPNLRPQVERGARQGARAVNLDLDAVRLTPDGFVPI